MNRGLPTTIVAVIFEAMFLATSDYGPTQEPQNRDPLASTNRFLKAINDPKLTSVLPAGPRFLMDLDTQLRCGSASTEDSEVHFPKYCEVYISPESLPAIMNSASDYPVGTIIVKWKFDKREGGNRELGTVMRKMPAGYSAEHGDWEFSVVNADATKLLARGRIDSCISCHDQYRDTGFVTRKYMNDSKFSIRLEDSKNESKN